MNLGKAIKLCRTQKNMKQSDLADLAQISVSYLSLLEQGKRDPNFSTVQHIASALNIPISILAFLAAEKEEILDISPELAEKLSYTALQLIGASANESPSLPK
jgi:transcriptional regulator with XRE-family HTH domain